MFKWTLKRYKYLYTIAEYNFIQNLWIVEDNAYNFFL